MLYIYLDLDPLLLVMECEALPSIHHWYSEVYDSTLFLRPPSFPFESIFGRVTIALAFAFLFGFGHLCEEEAEVSRPGPKSLSG